MSTPPPIGLRIHVGTLAGARRGVPSLLEQLHPLKAKASFLLCLGPDRSGRALKQAWRLAPHCGWSTLIRGTLIPGSTIGRKAEQALRQIEAAGFEAGLSAWNRVAWEQQAATADNPWIEREIHLGMAAFEALFAHPPKLFGAPHWQGHRHHLRLLQRLGFTHASDSLGHSPFLPVFQGELLPCPQFPTTLPTLSSLIRQGMNAKAAVNTLIQQTNQATAPQVFSLSADDEGLRHIDTLTPLLAHWQQQGHRLVTLGELAAEFPRSTLPYHEIYHSEASSPSTTPPAALVQGDEHLVLKPSR